MRRNTSINGCFCLLILIGVILPGPGEAQPLSGGQISMGELVVSSANLPIALLDVEDPAAWMGMIEEAVYFAFRDEPDAHLAMLCIAFHADRPTALELCCRPPCAPQIISALEERLGIDTMPRMKCGEFAVVQHFAVNDYETLSTEDEIPCDFEFPQERRLRQFDALSFAERPRFLAAWARSEVLPVLGHILGKVDAKFEGVRGQAAVMRGTESLGQETVASLTDSSGTYWRARLEMAVADVSIIASRVFMHLAHGEIERTQNLLLLLYKFHWEPSAANDYLEELRALLTIYLDQRHSLIKQGISAFDRGDSQEAIRVYRQVLQADSSCAWAWHEYFLARETTADLESAEDGYDTHVYGANPLYPIGMFASTGESAFRIERRMGISELFADPDSFAEDLLSYADIALDVETLGLAAEIYWQAILYNEENRDRALDGFLYCLEQLGVTDIKANFRGDAQARFRRVEDAARVRMESSVMYQAMHKKR
ncbi:hypothetical protein ACFL6M_01435 [Candidatus Eisenbacteria bacterium]|uniref:Tetratricopeptide repeat protein n=1 Tax=Eiseniibacteriota bacterium TaxID=2212470 RepID=A0ABV6YIR8_UNCEI